MRGGVAGICWRDLDRYEPVVAVGGVVGGAEECQGVDDVGDRKVPIGVLDASTLRHQQRELSVIGIGALDGPGHDGRVRDQ